MHPRRALCSSGGTAMLASMAGCLLATAGCVNEPAVAGDADYRPAPRSALVTRVDLAFLVAKQTTGAESSTILALQQEGWAPQPVARVVQVREGQKRTVSVQLVPKPIDIPKSASLELATLEQLYALLLHHDPEARYCLGSVEQCDATQEGLSHARMLSTLADLRERVAVDFPHTVRWRVVEMDAPPDPSPNADRVSVRATSRQQPLQNIAIYFNRAPHSICAARTLVDGVAACTLEDQHADGHEDDSANAVVAIFPGDVKADHVLLPTTHVLYRASPTAPPLTQPVNWPEHKP